MLFESFFDKINEKYIDKINFESVFKIAIIVFIEFRDRFSLKDKE